jgi:hypothetical protein
MTDPTCVRETITVAFLLIVNERSTHRTRKAVSGVR